VDGFDQEIDMLSKRFFAWVGIGVLSAATIPALAAPQLARLAARKGVAAKTAVAKPTPVKAPTKAGAVAKAAAKPIAGKAAVKTTALVAHKPAVAPLKKAPVHAMAKAPSKATSGRLASRSANAATLVHKPGTTVKKPAIAAHKPTVVKTAHKATASSTAKKLLH
jgi:hypothetical protein